MIGRSSIDQFGGDAIVAGAQLYRIVYLSRAARSFSGQELEDLRSEASRLNDDANVSGLLLYDGARFLQALEGSRDAVTATMDRIVRDVRHDSIAYIQDGFVNERQFGPWAMQFKLAPLGCCSTDFLDRVKEDVTLVDEPNLRAAFIGFAVLSVQRPRGYVCTNE